jgi:hypothetical protein
MSITTIGPDPSWRLVFNDTDVLMLENLHGYTSTLHNVFESQSKQECLDKIAELGLKYTPEEE